MKTKVVTTVIRESGDVKLVCEAGMNGVLEIDEFSEIVLSSATAANVVKVLAAWLGCEAVPTAIEGEV